MSEIELEGPVYIPPRVAVVVGALLRGPRQVGHSVNFSDLFSPLQEERRAYVDGLSAVPVIFFSFFLAWAFITLMLKFKGKEVGCASGRAFASHRFEHENNDLHHENDELPQGKSEEYLASTSESSNADTISETSIKPLFLGPDGAMMKHSDENNDNENHCGKKILRCFRRNNQEGATDNPEINLLERKTRISFLLFASITLLCTQLSLFLTFGPLREVTEEMSIVESSDSLLLKIQTIFEEVETSLNSIDSLSMDAVELVNAVPTDLDTVCPLVNSSDLESAIGVDINEIIQTVIQQQYALEENIASKMPSRRDFADGMGLVLSTMEIYINESKKYVWILPGLLLTVIGLTVTVSAGVILAWKEKSSVRLQKVLSYVVLPLLILVATASWIVMILFSLGSMGGSDICLSSSLVGSPDQTIQEIVSVIGNETKGSLYEFASTYVNDCYASDPATEIHSIKLETQDHIDNIWRQISKIDAVGRATAIEKCGNTDEFPEMISGARTLAMILTDIRRSLSNLENSVGCKSIHPIYIEGAHDLICTQTLSASGYGFLTFLIMWICIMAMISMRASWLSNIEEDKVYHDETDVAENMIVDEHEEYLAYISRYKHEWQEYEGIEEDARNDFHEDQLVESLDESDQNDYYGEDEEESASHISNLSTLDGKSLYIECKPPQESPIQYQRQLTTHEIMGHHDDGMSCASGEISFASLSSAIKPDALSLGNILTLAPPENPPPTNPNYSNEEEKQLDTDANTDTGENCNPGIEVELSDHNLLSTGEEVEVQNKDL